MSKKGAAKAASLTKGKIMYTFKVSFKDWVGNLISAQMKICDQPDRHAAVACIRAELAINGWQLITIE